MVDDKLISLEGVVDDIIYKNDETGYIVCQVEILDESITMVGIMPYLMEGESIIAHGMYATHSVYGQQFKVIEYERKMPKTSAAIQSFLGSGAIKGVGAVLAARIVDMFGESTLEIIESDIESLSKIKGITKKKAKQISDFVNFQMGIKKVIDYCSSLGLMPIIAVRAYKIFGIETISTIKQNPYVLCELGLFIAFETVDNVAIKIGIEKQDYQRVRSGLLFCLTHNLLNGHTYLPQNKLFEIAMGLLNLDEEDVLYEAIEVMFEEQDIVKVLKDDVECVFLTDMYFAENSIAHRIASMADDKSDNVNEIDLYIEEIENKCKIKYANLQKKAIKKALQSKLFILTGGPGTGKTTTIKAIIEIFKLMKKDVVLTAPTGRAAQRMSQLCDFEAKTIHRLLEVDHRSFDAKLNFNRNQQNPIDADVVIVDECSMVDVQLMDSLLKAIKKSANVILVGDYFQLPSVGAGNVLKDIIASECVDIVELNEIFRQAAQSLIVVNAHTIKDGEYPKLNTIDNDFFFLSVNDEKKLVDTIVGLVKKRIPKAYNLDAIDDIQVITPTKKGVSGTKQLNNVLQEALNPSTQLYEKRHKDTIFRVGDKVMQIRNNYDLGWERVSDNTYGNGIFNGDVGRIISISTKDENLSIMFDDRIVQYSFEELDDLELAYAITVHKSQGSEFKVVILPLLSGPKQLFNREILYTAVTRAKELLIIVGDNQTIMKMVDNKRLSSRYSMLKNMIRMCMGI